MTLPPLRPVEPVEGVVTGPNDGTFSSACPTCGSLDKIWYSGPPSGIVCADCGRTVS